MADEPTPVEVTNVVKTEPAETGSDNSAENAKHESPTVEKTTETKQTTKVSGPPVQAPAPPVVADDWPREILAAIVILQFVVIIGYMIYANKSLDNLIVGAEISFVTTIINYYYGSSSGSTRKSLALENNTN